ncbi:MATE family efflux transporter [Parabacteroides bouchesdurhonensis]|uniref:MATE family efflux transporter n=1 Tax=Parabacteroides bouchesdurhonensis TaxID=1936995 RepID=UPI0018FF0013|nr:MATE family efflux transporter [Parabacteroides bouchesdurhonensis]
MDIHRLFRRPDGLKGKLFKLTGPIFLETLLILTLGVVDTLMLSHHSDNSVAAVGVVNQLLNMVFLLFNITTTGTAVMCALYFGAKNNKSFIQVVGTSLLFNAAVGLVISFVLTCFGERMLVMMDIRPDLMPDASVYMKIVGGFGFFQAITFTVSTVLRAANKPNYSMQVAFIINILNIIGNYTLIFGHFGFPALGVEGAAISTSVCRGIAMVFLFIVLFKRLIHRIPLAYFRPFPVKMLKDVLKIGLPSAVEQISYDASQVAIVYFINMLGNEILATRVYVMNIVIVGYLFSLSIAQATAVCTGNLVGAGKKQAAYTLSWYAWKRSLLITFIASLSVYLLGRPLLGLFTENETIISVAMSVLLVDLFLEQGRATVLLFLFSLRSVGDVIVPVLIELVCMWFFAVFCGYMFGIVLGLGLAGMWVAFAMDESSRGLVLAFRWHTQKWKRRDLMRKDVNIG